jgi:hypothetical protein
MTARRPPFLVHAPDPNPTLAARIVRGHNLGLIRDGWIVYYYNLGTLPKPSQVDPDALYVIETTDGRIMVRQLRPRHMEGRFDLLTATGPAELDVLLEWAQAVIWIKPYRPTSDEWAALEAAG